MWTVTNYANCKKLKKFEKNVIIPFFTELLYCKRLGYSDFLIYLKNQKNHFIIEQKKKRNRINFDNEKNNKMQNTYKLLEYICKRKTKKKLFLDYANDLLKNYSYNDLKSFFKIYIIQNKQLKNKSTKINVYPIPDSFKILFIDFFYEKFFSLDKIWLQFDESSFSRNEFHINFKKENNIFVCPYCDIDTTMNIGNNQIEHFWPKSHFPFLSMNALNLVSSCHSCNMPLEGKGTTIKIPVSMPYVKQADDYISFKMNISKEIVELMTSHSDVSNYIDLLQLQKRYANSFVYDNLFLSCQSTYTDLIQYENRQSRKLSSSEISDYITTAKKYDKKKQPLYFAQLSIFKSYDKYSTYLRKENK
ncbi:MAG: hypothetical protein ACLSAC_29045 [Enterocloster bolteae]